MKRTVVGDWQDPVNQPAVVVQRTPPLRSVVAACLACCWLLFARCPSLPAQNAPEDDVEQRGVLRRIDEVEEALRKESWLEAVQRFDEAWSLAAEGPDVLLEQRGADIRQLAPGEADVLAGGKARLEQVYRTAGDEFRRLYADQFNETASQALRGFLERGQTDRLKSVAARYQWTPAGAQSLQLLARMHIDAGDFLEAGLLLERSAGLSEPADPLITLRAAWCFAKAGLLTESQELAAASLARFSSDNKPLNPQLQTLQNDIDTLARSLAAEPSAAAQNWLQPLGDYRRTKRQATASLRLTGTWQNSLYQLWDVLYADRMNPLLAATWPRVEELWRNMLDSGALGLPAAQPLAVGDRVFVRTPFSIQAWNSTHGELLWEVARPDRALKEAADNLNSKSDDPGVPDERNSRISADAANLTYQLFLQQVRASTAAQMAISQSTLFVVEETAAAADELDDFRGMIRGMPTLPSNYIRAYDVETGLFRWEIGGQVQNAVPGQAGSSNLLAGYYFLGAPLVLGNRIYVLAENGDGIYLIRIGEPAPNVAGANPQILASQLLTIPDRKLPEHPLRRYAGLMPTYAHGLLICPTCDDRVVAVSAEDLSIRWIARYGGILRRQEIGDDRSIVLFGAQDGRRTIAVDLENRWCDFLPRVVHNRILLTPRDADQLFCLDLETGRQLWTAARGGYHAIAGTTEQLVVLAGRRQVGALNLETGAEVWTTSLRDGTVCGSGVFTGTLLQLPTTAPSLVSINVADGRMLASQPWSGNGQPGNLLALPGGTLVQGITTLTWLPKVTENLQPIERATQLVLEGDAAAGREVLEAHLQQQPADQIVRMLLIDMLLSELRRSEADADVLVPKIEQLLSQLAREAELGPLLHSMLGMTLPDAAAIPGLLRTAGRQRNEEFREILLQREAAQSPQAPLKMLLPRLERMLRELPQAMLAAAPATGLERSQADVLAAVIRSSLRQRPLPEQIELQTQLVSPARETAAGMPLEQQLDFAAVLLRCDLSFAAVGVLTAADVNENAGANPAAAAALNRLKSRIALALEHARLAALRTPTPNSTALLAGLLENLHQTGGPWQAWSLVRSLQSPAPTPANTQQQLLQSSLELLRQKNPSLQLDAPPASSWPEEFQTQVSDDRTVVAASSDPEHVPWQPIPLYGNPGLHQGWNFAWIKPGNRIAAYNPDGVLQWIWQPDWNVNPGTGGYLLDSWAFVSGRLLVLHLRGAVAALDLTGAGQQSPPQLLWRVMPERTAGDDPDMDPRNFVLPEERIEQYQLLPGGHFPVGPVSEFGVPLITGRSLQMLNLFTGARLWELDVIPADARLLLDHDRLLVLSDSARQTEVRSAIDGTLLETHRLPEWWSEAGSNQGLSVEDIDVEEGTETLWRVLAEDRRCVLFRLTAGETRLECRDLTTDQVLWQHVLPRKTVVSNVADEATALLSEGRQLKIINLTDGSIRVNRELTPVVEPRKLYLRSSQGLFIVLPEALSEEDPSLDFFNPLIDAVHVHGRVYGIRQDDGTLVWEHAVKHSQLRLEHSSQTRPLLPVFPLLVLLTRERDPNSRGAAVVVGTEVLDVRNGKVLYADPNTGLTQNLLWLYTTQPGELMLSFDRRFVRFGKGNE